MAKNIPFNNSLTENLPPTIYMPQVFEPTSNDGILYHSIYGTDRQPFYPFRSTYSGYVTVAFDTPTGSTDNYLGVDFTTIKIDRVTISGISVGYFTNNTSSITITDSYIETSADNSSWTTISDHHTCTFATGTYPVFIYKLTKVPSRYTRVRVKTSVALNLQNRYEGGIRLFRLLYSNSSLSLT